jgi:hypothetical protein
MDHPALRGCSILSVEYEPLIALDIVTVLELAGAHATDITHSAMVTAHSSAHF